MSCRFCFNRSDRMYMMDHLVYEPVIARTKNVSCPSHFNLLARIATTSRAPRRTSVTCYLCLRDPCDPWHASVRANPISFGAYTNIEISKWFTLELYQVLQILNLNSWKNWHKKSGTSIMENHDFYEWTKTLTFTDNWQLLIWSSVCFIRTNTSTSICVGCGQ